MTMAMESALSTLPHPLGSARVQSIAETILRSSKEGEKRSQGPGANGFAGAYDLAAELMARFSPKEPSCGLDQVLAVRNLRELCITRYLPAMSVAVFAPVRGQTVGTLKQSKATHVSRFNRSSERSYR